jgi:predicted PolB exonuclease-like 3'-5' exonuclease
MRYLILDIETLPHPDANQWLEPVTAAANLKDPVKIAASLAERQAERDDKLGLDPDCCQICAVGWHVVGGEDPTCLVARNEEEEALAIRLLADAYAAPQGQQETRIVTFYGRQFDLPVLMRRAMYLGVKFPALSLDRYRSPHIDVWDALTYNGALRTAHSLKFYAKRMGFTTLDKVDGGDVRTLAAAGNWDAIREHCLSDVGLCHAVANKLGLLRM